MATQTIEFNATTGLSLTAKLFAEGSDTEAASVAAMEATNRRGRYVAAFTDLTAGAYNLIAFVGLVGGFANEVFDVADATATFYPRSEANAPTPAQIAAAVRTELATELGRVDADVSSRLAAADYVEPSANLDLSAETIADIAEAVAGNVTPGVGSSAAPVDLTTLRAFQGETVAQSVTAFAADKTTPLDLSGKTLVLLFETEREAFVASIPNNQLTIGGANNNVLTFTYPAAVTADRSPKIWSLRDAADPRKVYLHGLVEIRRAATKTAAA